MEEGALELERLEEEEKGGETEGEEERGRRTTGLGLAVGDGSEDFVKSEKRKVSTISSALKILFNQFFFN